MSAATPAPGPKPIRVFLSHSGADTPAARQLTEILRRNGLIVWFDKDSIPPGKLWMEQIERGVQDSEAMLVLIGRMGVQTWVDREVRLGLERATQSPDQYQLIPIFGEGSAGPGTLPPFLRQHQGVDLRNSTDAPAQIQRLIEVLTSKTSHPPVPAEYWETQSPFRSLQEFDPEDAWLFFGRDAETADLVARLDRGPVLAMLGNSGCGKSSLLCAGLIPALQLGRFRSAGSAVDCWKVCVFRPTASPFEALAEALPSLMHRPKPEEVEAAVARWKTALPAGPDGLRNILVGLRSTAPQDTWPERTRVLLVADQFEEIFTLTPSGPEREAYIDALLAAARHGANPAVHVILSLRADFYSRCLDHPGLSRCLETNLVNVPLMSQEQLRKAIENPLALSGTKAEAGLIESLIQDAGAEPGNLALLEHALGQLWEKRDRSRSILTNASYEEIGRLRGALGRHADTVLAGFREEAERKMVESIFLELVQLGEGAQDTRRRVRKETLFELGDAGVVERLIGTLASQRLIATGGGQGDGFVEVSHEALIREWPKLRGWLDGNREGLKLQRRLAEMAGEWERLGRDSGALLRGLPLAQAEDWLSARDRAPGLLREFIEASRKERERLDREAEDTRQRELTRTRRFSYALAALLLVAAAAGWFANQQRRIAESRELAARAEAVYPRDPGQALGLAVRAWERERTAEARAAIARTIAGTPTILEGHTSGVSHAAFSPDGQRIITTSYDNPAGVWNSVNGRLLAALEGHVGSVNHAAFSPDGQRIITASDDKTARLWDSASGQSLAKLEGHVGSVNHAAFSPDGQRIVTASDDRTARVWNSANGQLLARLEGHTGSVRHAAFSPDGQRIVTASEDNTARVWNSANGQLLTALEGHTGSVRHAAFSPDGQRIVTADDTARVWNSASGQLLATLEGHTESVRHAAFSADGRRIVTASNDNTARVWNSANGQFLARLEGHTADVNHAVFSPDGQRIVTASDDKTARVWNPTDGKLLAKFEGHTANVNHAAFSPDGERIVTASHDNSARVWNSANGQSVAKLEGHTASIWRGAFSPDGQCIVTASSDKTARLWNSANGELLAILAGHTDLVLHAAFSSDGQRVVTASGDRTARLWNSANGELLAILAGHTDLVLHAAFSSDGQRVVTASGDKTARLWNSADGKLLVTLEGHANGIRHVAFSPDGQRIITASSDNTARLWNAADGKFLARLEGHTADVNHAVFSPDGQHIVTASDDHTARVWNSANGQFLAKLQGHTDSVVHAAFSPDGQLIVTASNDHTARVWNSANGQLLAKLEGHTRHVNHAAFSPDGQRVVTASFDKTARVWNAANGQLLAELEGPTDSVNHAAFSPDGQRIVTACGDGTARVWKILTLDDVAKLLE